MGIVCLALWVYYLVLLARIIMSWVTMAWSPPPALAPVMRVVYDLTEPVLGLFRRYIPPIGGLDLSPLFIFIILSIVQRSIC
ncbi:MAG: YggT family protein [Actinomycetota bacterium]|jgi:YggT family protein